MLKQRIITALVLVITLGSGVYYFPYSGFLLFAAVIILLAGWEWANLSGLSSMPGRCAYLVLLAASLLATGAYCSLAQLSQINLANVQQLLGLGGIWWAIALLWVKAYPASAVLWGSLPARAVMGLLVLVPCWLALVYLRSLDDGIVCLAYLIGIVVTADTGAYFSGRKFGKSKLAPAVSPGKSWAGFWGGFICASLMAASIGAFYSIAGLSHVALIGVTMVSALASVLGDLLESMIKRHRGIKDSSKLLPGHGGVMDRIDSLTATAPVFALFVILLR